LTENALPTDLLSSLVPEQGRQPGPHFVDPFGCAVPEFFGVARFPIDAPHVVGEDDTGCTAVGGNGDLEWVSFGLVRDGARQRQASLLARSDPVAFD
jgi:hypothetical protein